MDSHPFHPKGWRATCLPLLMYPACIFGFIPKWVVVVNCQKEQMCRKGEEQNHQRWGRVRVSSTYPALRSERTDKPRACSPSMIPLMARRTGRIATSQESCRSFRACSGVREKRLATRTSYGQYRG